MDELKEEIFEAMYGIAQKIKLTNLVSKESLERASLDYQTFHFYDEVRDVDLTITAYIDWKLEQSIVEDCKKLADKYSQYNWQELSPSYEIDAFNTLDIISINVKFIYLSKIGV